MQARLAATDLACRRGDRLLFRGLSFACAPGDAVHIAGANGIGKSSLIRILAGLLRPFSGEVVRAGKIGLTDERLALDENLPLGKALAFWERLDGLRNARPRDDVLQLNALRDVPVRFLSTGQRKRAALARLLNAAPPIWLLDEPLNGLDEQARKTVEKLVAEHRAGGAIAVVASHQPVVLPGAQIIDLAEYAA